MVEELLELLGDTENADLAEGMGMSQNMISIIRNPNYPLLLPVIKFWQAIKSSKQEGGWWLIFQQTHSKAEVIV